MPTPEAPEIRWARPDDWRALAAILAEIRDHYRDEPIARDTIEARARDWLRPEPGCNRFAIAFAGDIPIGLVSAAIVRPVPGPGGALYMKELFVSAEWRGTGVGRRLLAFLAEFCIAEELERMDFTTEDWNDGALRFYQREGATVQRQKIALRFNSASLERLAAGQKEAS